MDSLLRASSLHHTRIKIYIAPRNSKLLSLQRPQQLLPFPLTRSKRLPLSRKRWICRFSVVEDAPFVVAIGASIFSSLVFMKQTEEKVESQGNAALRGDDVRDGAMTIISLIPIFNWLGWIFAWLDTNEQRYLFYAAVYLAPYVRTGFSFNSEENWLLVLSYMACIAHVQVEISAQSGGIEIGLGDGLKQLQRNLRSRLLGDHSPRFMDSVLPNDKVQDLPPEEDMSKIELSEFDKKLSSVKKTHEDELQSSAEDFEDDNGSKKS